MLRLILVLQEVRDRCYNSADGNVLRYTRCYYTIHRISANS